MSATDAAYEEAVKTVESCAKKFQKAYDEIADKVDLALKFLPGQLEQRIRDSMTKLTAEHGDSKVRFMDLWLERGSAGALRDAASEWTLKVGAVASGYSTQVSFAQLPSKEDWSGPAQVAYRSVVDQQSKLLGDFKTVVDDLNSILNDLADALKAYWVSIAIEATACAGVLVACAVGSAAVATLPATILTAVGAIVGFWIFVAGATVLYHNVLDANEAKLKSILAINGTEGKWPAASVEESTSGWTPNP
jgi:uncharacterized protein YukE